MVHQLCKLWSSDRLLKTYYGFNVFLSFGVLYTFLIYVHAKDLESYKVCTNKSSSLPQKTAP